MTTTTDIFNPDLHVDGPIHEIPTELRRTDPVHWQPMCDEPGYREILQHADLTHVARHPERSNPSDVLESLPILAARS